MGFKSAMGKAFKAPFKAPGMGAITKPLNKTIGQPVNKTVIKPAQNMMNKVPGVAPMANKVGLGPTLGPRPQPPMNQPQQVPQLPPMQQQGPENTGVAGPNPSGGSPVQGGNWDFNKWQQMMQGPQMHDMVNRPTDQGWNRGMAHPAVQGWNQPGQFGNMPMQPPNQGPMQNMDTRTAMNAPPEIGNAAGPAPQFGGLSPSQGMMGGMFGQGPMRRMMGRHTTNM